MLKIATRSIISKYIKHKVLGKEEITESELNGILREIRIALLNSDVNLEVIKAFFSEIKQELLVNKNYRSGEELDVIVFSTIRRKLISILGDKVEELSYNPNKLGRILVVGLNGSGKTTTTAKLAYYFKNKYKAKVKTISLDIYRPGAYDQLKQLTEPVDIPCFPTTSKNFRETIKEKTFESENDGTSCLFFDNYGFLPDNEELIEETASIKKTINPQEILFVVDAMAGQEILDSVKLFHERIGLTGIVISKTDSNAPMGAVFSIAYLLKLPIKLMGKGEGIGDLSVFYPERIASLILGEGDILSLAEKMEEVGDVDTSKKLFFKIMKGNFDLEDLVKQIREVRKMGPMKNLIKMLPGFSEKVSSSNVDTLEAQLRIWEIIISSMTLKERRNPKLFKKQPNRRVRVVKGSGRKPDELNKLLKKWEDVRKKMDDVASGFNKGKNPLSLFMKS